MPSSTWPAGLRRRILRRDGYLCRLCLSGDRLEVDHIWPRCHGGPTVEWNLRTLCHACNLAKRNANAELPAGRLPRVLGPPRPRHRGIRHHGTPSAYGHHKCRCSECRRWAREARAKYRAAASLR